MDTREDVETFADRVRKVNDRTYNASGSAEYVAAIRFEADQRALDAFLNGLPGELGRQCRLAAPGSFEEAIRAAIRVREAERRPGEAPAARRVFRTPNGSACFNCGQTEHFMRHFMRACRRGRRCHSCGQEGHLQRDCRSRRGPGGNPNLNGAGVGEAAESDPW
ncbi:DNA-binding protein HEXBP-like [Ischnura elegans]|uniref:DNA-binding protein HEXBP-like n=1 Tax=Ischnura elegans TaxID=197161 RepID=UPI001ED8BA33|nr:DNA-binding protein HEXBP-like [Ischnura elegans]